MFGVHLPSLSDVKNAVTGATSTALHTAQDLGSSAASHAASLGREGLDLGRSAVNAVSHVDVQKVGAAVTGAIGKAEDWAEKGIRTGVMDAGKGVHSAANFARSHITGNDPLSRLARGGITAAEDVTRFQIGVVGGVGNAAVGLVGSAGQLSVMAAEYQYSPAARAAIDAKVVGGVESGAKAVAGYATSVAQDPSRVVGDVEGAAKAGAGWVGGVVDSADQAIKDGHGPESFGMVAGNAATYLIPVGGEVRAVAGAGEVAARGLTTALAEDGTRALAETGAKTLAETAPKAIPAISDIARAGIPGAAERTGLSEAKITEILETPKGERPLPETYLSQAYRDAHLAQWDQGAVRITSRSQLVRYGTLGPEGGFTVPAGQFRSVLQRTGGDLSKIETELGLTAGQLSSGDTLIVRIAPKNLDHLRLPSGREGGANEHWLPGGYTSGGQPEAAMDFPSMLPYEEIDIGAA